MTGLIERIEISDEGGMLKLLRAIEWVKSDLKPDRSHCPRCSGPAPIHIPDCELAAAIAFEVEIKDMLDEEDRNPPPRHDPGLVIAMAMIKVERERQVDVEGWTPEHDDKHSAGEMAMAAAAYCVADKVRDPGRSPYLALLWPWSADWWKPKSRERDLVRAGALIVAELQRLFRKNSKELQGG